MGWRNAPTKAGKSAAAPNWSQFEGRSQVTPQDTENKSAGRGRIRFRQVRKAPSLVVTSLSLVVTWPSIVVTSPSLVVTWLSSLVTSLSFVVTFLSSLVTFPSRLVTRGRRARKSSRKKCNRQAVHRKKRCAIFFRSFFQPVTALLGWSLKKVVNKLLIIDDVVPFVFCRPQYIVVFLAGHGRFTVYKFCTMVHCLRHTYATMTEAHTDAITLMSVLGHADPKTTRRYTHVIQDNVRKLAAVDIYVTPKVPKPVEK